MATVILDIGNSARLLGTPEQIAAAIQREVRGAGYEASVSISRNAYAAVLAARGYGSPDLRPSKPTPGLPGTPLPALVRLGTNAGITIIPTGHEAQTLAPLPLTILELDVEQTQTLAAWGIRTLGQLAALPARSLAARLGQSGLRLQAQARGDYNHLLVPTEEPADAPLCADIELEQPVELLEPLLFLLNQMLQQVLERAAKRALAIASMEICLRPAKDVGSKGADREDRRIVRPALPERNRLVLLKLIQLELELRRPTAAVVAMRLVAHPSRPQTAQQGLFAAQAPEPGRMAVLLARLRKLVGEGRAGSPELLDSRAPEAFRMTAFAPSDSEEHWADKGESGPGAPASPPLLRPSGEDSITQHAPALRMVRPPREVAVKLCRGAPVAMSCEGRPRMVQASSGPWRTSGAWWTHPAWCREEWEVLVQKDASGNEVLRLAHDPANGGWYWIGVYD